MGIGGAVGFLQKQGHAWARNIVLKDMYVVIDITNALYWFLKVRLLDRTQMDIYGTSMIELGALYRRLFQSLRERNVKPIVVLDGGRKSEQRFGPLASKQQFLTKSCNLALENLKEFRHGTRSGRRQRKLYNSLPQLASNAIKEIMNEFEIEYVHQSAYEVYPGLVHWANKKQCPVLTSHSDFTFYNAPNGFIWMEELKLPPDATQPFTCRLYRHDLMLQHYRMDPARSSALRTLSVLLRDDFYETYRGAVNNVLGLTNNPRLAYETFRVKTARVIYVMNLCRQNSDILASGESVRSILASQPNSTNGNLMRDFDAILDTYTTYHENFFDTEFGQWYRHGPITQANLLEALTRGETTAEFAFSVGPSTSYARTVVEDVDTFRSTYSVHDNCRQQLLNSTVSAQFNTMRIYDRRRDAMHDRSLARQGGTATNNTTTTSGVKSPASADAPQTNGLSRESLFEKYHFNSQQLEQLGNNLTTNYGIEADSSNQLALQLLLARYACKIMYRDHYSNANDSVQTLTNTQSNSIGSSAQLLDERKKKFITAIANSFVYHARAGQGDQSNMDVPADIRVARDKMVSIARDVPNVQPSGTNPDEYYRMKHMIESLNSAIHGYKDLNSLHGFPGPNLHVCKYYDGVLIYKIMSRWSANLQAYLIRLSDDIITDLIGNTAN